MPGSDQDYFPDTTEVSLIWDTLPYVLTSSQAWLKSNRIDLILINENSGDFFELQFTNQAGSWTILPIIPPGVLDCLYVSSEFRILDQSLKLNKQRYRSGDSLRGLIDLHLLGKKTFFREPLVPFVDKRKWDTIRMKGGFSTKISSY